jgi:hypothetical protein
MRSAFPARGSESVTDQKSGFERCSSGAHGRSPRQAPDPHEREALAMRTAQVPRGRCIRVFAYNNDDREERLDVHAPGLSRRMHPAKVADAVLSRRQDMLQIPPDELVRSERAFLFLLRGGIGVPKRHRLIVRVHDPFVADRGLADVARQIAHDVLTGASVGKMDPPAFAPHRVANLRMQLRSGGLQRLLGGEQSESRSARR